MDGQLIPTGLFVMEPAWRNLFENAMTVQFVHRLVAYLVLALIFWHAWAAFTVRVWILAYMAIVQVVLGIWALVWDVPLPLALLHQANAMIVMMVAVWNLSGTLTIRKVKPVSSLAPATPVAAAVPMSDG